MLSGSFRPIPPKRIPARGTTPPTHGAMRIIDTFERRRRNAQRKPQERRAGG
jgi:hypothetical protein